MFGCKVGQGVRVFLMHAASPGGANHFFCCLFMCLLVGRVTKAGMLGPRREPVGFGSQESPMIFQHAMLTAKSVVQDPVVACRSSKSSYALERGRLTWLSAWDLVTFS